MWARCGGLLRAGWGAGRAQPAEPSRRRTTCCACANLRAFVAIYQSTNLPICQSAIRTAAPPSDPRAPRGGPGDTRPRRTPRASATIAATIVVGSVGSRPNSCDATRRPAPSAPAMPIAMPAMTSSIDSRSTRPSTSLRCGAHRHADADFARPARHVVRHQAEQPDRGNEQRDAAEERVGLREHFLLRETPLDRRRSAFRL